MTVVIAIYVFMLGAALGSFALVVAERWHTKRSWVKGRSQCDTCKKNLQPVDLVPLFSWLAFRGQCRHCGAKISRRYPLSELLSAVMLLTVFLWFPYDMTESMFAIILFLIWIVIHTLSVILLLVDLRSMLLPYVFVIPLIAVAGVFRLIILSVPSLDHPSLVSLTIGVLLGAGLFAILWYVSKGKWIGDSDILLGSAIALIVGGAVEVWIAFITASVAGLLFGTISSFSTHKKLRHMKIPFGPFLILGMVVSLLFSPVIIDAYMTAFLPY